MAVKQTIRSIKAQKDADIVEALTKQIIAELKWRGLSSLAIHDDFSMSLQDSKLLLVTVRDGKYTYIIDLSRVKDELFLSTIEYRVKKLTGGFFNLDLVQQKLWLAP